MPMEGDCNSAEDQVVYKKMSIQENKKKPTFLKKKKSHQVYLLSTENI